MIDLVFENQTKDMAWSEDFFREVLSCSLSHLKLRDNTVELGLYLVAPERSQELNKKYRQKDKPTDVLSFPLNEHGLKKYGILPLGDIFICLEIAQRQANEMSIPADQELIRLVVHGLLHLLGYDHELSSDDEKKMIDLQEEIVTEVLKLKS